MKPEALKVGSQVAITQCFVARSFVSRFLGLMGRRHLPEDQAVLFPNCTSIHTFFMRFAIDVVLVGSRGEVIRVIPAMKPWRLMLPTRGVRHVIELAASVAKKRGIEPGVQLHCAGVWA